MDFTDKLNLELTDNHKLAFKIAMDKIYPPIDFKTWMFLYATNWQDRDNPNTLFFKDRVTRETIKIGYDLSDLAEVV